MRGQGMLVSFLNPSTNNWEIGSFDLGTCTYTPSIVDVDISIIGDFVLAENDIYYALGASPGQQGSFWEAGLYTIDPTTGQTTLLTGLGTIYLTGSILQLNPTTLVIAMTDNIYLYDIPTGVLTLAGMIESTHIPELFLYQGNVYIGSINLGAGGFSWLTQLNFSPFSTTYVYQSVNFGYPVGVCGNVFSLSEGGAGFGPGFSIVENNMSNNTLDAVCLGIPEFAGAQQFTFSFAPDPTQTSGPLCDCITESGIITPGSGQQGNLYVVCGENSFPIPHLGDEVLDGDDALVFLLVGPGNLYDNYPNNVVYIYDTPVANFIPGVTQYNVLYRIYPAASNAVPGSVDWDDTCLEIGSPVSIRWTSGPAVNFTFLSQNCTTGCQTVRANFTGTPPYTLTYTVTTSNGQANTFTQISTSQVLNLNICPPAGYAGPLAVQATNLVDANCTCGQ